MPVKFYTEEEFNKQTKHILNITSLLNEITEYFQNELETEKKDENSWNYIPNRDYLNLSKKLLLIKKSYKYKTPTFLDCGCGIGLISVFAEQHGFTSTGLEIQDKSIEIAKKISFCKFIKKDILKYKKYGDYDVIYFYCPFNINRKPNPQEIFEKIVADQMKIGAFVITINCGTVFDSDKRFKIIAFNVYKKIKI